MGSSQQYSNSPYPTARKIWKDYFPVVDTLVFIIDAVDRNRFLESKEELDALLSDDQISQLPILILGNKIDCAGGTSCIILFLFCDVFCSLINQTLITSKACKFSAIYHLLNFGDLLSQQTKLAFRRGFRG